MDTEKTYSVIDLAEAVGVPRTTINDWLARHAAYIDSKAQGRRKVYMDSSVAVLKEIAVLRNKGLSSIEIEAELAKTHPIHPEPAEAKSSPHPAQENTPETQAQQASSGDYALIAKQQSDELGRLIAESFGTMAERLKTLEEKSKVSRRRLVTGYAAVFVLVAMLIALVIAGLMFYDANSARLDDNTKAAAKNTESVKSLDDRTVRLTGSTEEIKQAVTALKSGLKEQEEQFKKSLEAMKSAKDAELAALRDKFAAEQKASLDKLEHASAAERNAYLKEIERLNAENSSLRASADEQKIINEKLKAEAGKQKKSEKPENTPAQETAVPQPVTAVETPAQTPASTVGKDK